MNRVVLYIIVLFVAYFSSLPVEAGKKTFTVVIDAGHGGRDAGAIGSFLKEKHVNLSVALALGALIEKDIPDVRVIYTRKTDRFVELDERANIANRNNADLFISIHANSVKQATHVRGTETFTLGLARTEENLAVAMRENSAILMEDDYLQKYEGFNPNLTESYIIFEFMQNKYVEQSVSFASYIQDSFVSAKRLNRGVKQGGFIVLRKTSMPSVLVELGFISNKAEEAFLASEAGQKKLADSIYQAFVRYKDDYERKRGTLNLNDDKPNLQIASQAPETEGKQQSDTIYKIQIFSLNKKLGPTAKEFKGYKDVGCFEENGLYKYTYGETTDYEEICSLQQKVSKDFQGAFILKFKNGSRVTK